MLELATTIIGGAMVLVVGWAFAFQKRVSVLEADSKSVKELIEVKLDAIVQRLMNIEKTINKE